MNLGEEEEEGQGLEEEEYDLLSSYINSRDDMRREEEEEEGDMSEDMSSKADPPPLDPESVSVWTKISEAGVTVPAEVMDKLVEADEELSEGENSAAITLLESCCMLIHISPLTVTLVTVTPRLQ